MVKSERHIVVTPRRVFRLCAVVLAILGAAAVVALPTARSQAEARLSVTRPFTSGDVVRAIRTVAPRAAVRADGPRIVVGVTASKRRTARARAATIARAGLEAGLRRFVATAGAQTAAARSSEAQAASQLATLADRTGLTDPTPALQRLEAAVQGLELQRELAAAIGAPLGALDASLAANQQAMFELRAQVTRHDELVQAQARARQEELNASATSDAATFAARSASVVVADHTSTHWLRIFSAGAAFGLAAIVLLAGELRGRLQLPRWQLPPRRGAASAPIASAPADRAQTQPAPHPRPDPRSGEALNPLDPDEPRSVDTSVEQRRAYLLDVPERERDFYLALAVSQSEDPDGPASTSLDLVREEERERNRDTAASPQPVDEGGGPLPAKASVEAATAAPTATPTARGTEAELSGSPVQQTQPDSEGNSAASRRTHRRT
jgi:hypothetical protein